MLISEVISGDYMPAGSDLQNAIKDIITRAMAADLDEIDTEKLRVALAKQGYRIGIDMLLKAIDATGYASSVDANKVVPKDELSAEINTDEPEDAIDVGGMAGDQALSDIKADL